jgi:hypothetical protein
MVESMVTERVDCWAVLMVVAKDEMRVDYLGNQKAVWKVAVTVGRLAVLMVAMKAD